jgi:hypothetical protein
MAYTPDPTDITQPIGSVKAGTADEEFRALKAYIQGLVLGAVSQGPTVRQTALAGKQDANGDAAFLVAGTGLAINLLGLDQPLSLTYAAGSGAAGDINYSEAFGADTNDIVTGLAPSNLTYITKIFNGAWGKSLGPPSYDRVYDKTKQMLFRWPGINNAVTSTEDFGNAMTFAGNAKLSTGTQILGLNTLALDGTGDYVDAPVPNLGSGAWEFFGSFRTASLAAAQNVFSLGNAAGFGLLLRIQTTGKLAMFVSSNGTSFNVANATAGTATLVINTTYYFRFAFDPVAGTYRFYLSDNGAAETLDLSVASALITTASALSFRIGASAVGGSEAFNGNIGYLGFRKWVSSTTATAVGPTVAPTFADVALDWFSTSQMKMYQITAASVVSGTNPTMVAVNKIYLGEITTGAATVTSAVSYAFKGAYESSFTATLPLNVLASKTSNIGVADQNAKVVMECILADAGFVVGERVYFSTDNPGASGNFSGSLITTTKNTVSFFKANLYYASDHGSNTASTLTVASWKYKLIANRSW